MPSVIANDFIGKSPTISSPSFGGANNTTILSDRVIDSGLRCLPIEASIIRICSAYPGTFIQANADFSLGGKNFGTGGCFGAVTAGINGRKVATIAITDGQIDVTGTATHWAAVDISASRLLIVHALDAPVEVVAEALFTLPSFEITFTGQ